MTPRPAKPEDLSPLADLWHAGWHEAHAAHVPADLAALRNHAAFRARLDGFGDAIRCAGPVGAPVGMCVIQRHEIDQLYVARQARGQGLAEALLAEGEARLLAQGVTDAELACLPENTRAAQFYARCGWRNQGVRVVSLATAAGPYDLPCLVFAKHLRGAVQGHLA